MPLNVSGVLYGPCHGIVENALANRKWLYTRDLTNHTSLPSHIVEIALAQLISLRLVEYDDSLQRFKLKQIPERIARKRLEKVLAAQTDEPA